MGTAAVILHGAGSTGAFVSGAFSADDLGVDLLVTPDYRGGSEQGITALDASIRLCEAQGLTVEVVGGISMGAHAAARLALRRPALRATVLALPAWTGAPGPVGAATVAAGEEVEILGSARVLGRLLRQDRGDWVVDALKDAWPAYGDAALAASLRTAGHSPGPTLDELRSLEVPAAVIALRDDPLHPVEVARAWATAIPSSSITELPRDLSGRGPREIGRAAAAEVRAVSGSR